MKPVLIAIVALLLSSLISSSISIDYFSQQLYAQQQTSTRALTQPTTSTPLNATSITMKVYENSTYGIKIQYPSDWIYREQNRTNIVTFIPSSSLAPMSLNNMGRSSINQTNAPPLVTIGLEFLPFHNVPLNIYNKITINSLRQSPGFQIITSSPTVLSGSPASMIQYSQGPLITLAVYTIKGNQLYTVAYVVDSGQYSNYLPVAQQMVRSLAINSTACTENFC